MIKSTLVLAGLSLSLTGQVFASNNKVIYGEDNRVQAEESVNPLFKKLAISTAAMIKNTAIEPVFDGILQKINSETLRKSFNLCEDERFGQLQNAALCSGFLVGENLLVTAGHCIQNEGDCASNKWVFDYRQDLLGDNTDNISFVDSNNVYSCKKIINRVLSNVSHNDFALIELDRKVSGRTPLKFRTEGRIEDGTEIVVIGHPSGLPTIIADGAAVRKNDNDFFFSANLDTFGGNSGSAVFNAETGVVEGILVRGEQDYRMDPQAGCLRVFECKNDECRGEDVTRITNIPELAPGMTPVEPPAPEFNFDLFGQGVLPISGFVNFSN